jgi:hypothetical protein
MNKHISHLVLLILLGFMSSSCATILSGTKQTVRLNSSPSGAKVIINGQDKGLVTPCMAELKRKVKPSAYNSRNEYHYLFEKEGYVNTEIIEFRKINSKSFYNCIAYPFSVISFPIDFISGASYKYNENIYANLNPDPKQVSPAKITKNEIKELNEDKQPPVIKILSPDMSRGFKQIVQDETIEITGSASDESGLFEILVNGTPASINNDGAFYARISLSQGSNKITVIAKDKKMNTASESFYIERQSINENISLKPEILDNGNYHALIIGIQEYLDPNLIDLNEPLNDAQKLYNTLTQNYKFETQNVILLQNPTRDEITMALEKYFKTLGESDNLLIFYAGHGYWDEKFKQGYWLAADSRVDNRGTWLSNGTIRDYMRAISCKHSLLITDACFSGGIFKSREAFPDASKAVNELYKLPSRKAMTSGAMNEVPDKSVFLQYLIKRLDENQQKYLSSEELFASFKIAVINNSPQNQVPQFGEIKETGDEGGDFIFIKKD